MGAIKIERGDLNHSFTEAEPGPPVSGQFGE
jgi:hypothetical protein